MADTTGTRLLQFFAADVYLVTGAREYARRGAWRVAAPAEAARVAPATARVLVA
jgi:hypothetical protein